MAIILDADVIIAGERGAFDIRSWLLSQPEERFEIAVITVAELWHGVQRASGQHRTQRERYLRVIIGALPIIPYTEQTAYEHARVWAELEAAGKMIGFYDVVVAATALERGSAIASFNRKHFSHVKALVLIEPKQIA